jgi:hypothetical protein
MQGDSDSVFAFKSVGPLSNPMSLCAGMLVLSAIFLFYTAVIVPIQICLWSYDDPCTMFPTLFFDVLVDVFFMVLSDMEGYPELLCCRRSPNVLLIFALKPAA